jgi:lipid II:glycine glycyltransferase (peptidoglycan interpeptide bridge formation enzyme)
MEFQCLVSKLKDIQKSLGGPLDDIIKKETDEFNRIKLCLAETVNFTSKKQDERDATNEKLGRNAAVIRAGVDIRDKLNEAEEQLGQMKEALRRQRKNPKKYPQAQIELKEKQYQNCIDMVHQLNVREEGGASTTDPDDKLTLTGMKMQLHGGGGGNKRGSFENRDLEKHEEDAIKRFQEKDKELDEAISKIDEGLSILKDKAELIGENIKNQEIALEELNVVVTKTQAKLNSSNTKLKKILFEYRKPGQFCMEICCFLILFGLIGVIVKLSMDG